MGILISIPEHKGTKKFYYISIRVIESGIGWYLNFQIFQELKIQLPVFTSFLFFVTSKHLSSPPYCIVNMSIIISGWVPPRLNCRNSLRRGFILSVFRFILMFYKCVRWKKSFLEENNHNIYGERKGIYSFYSKYSKVGFFFAI